MRSYTLCKATGAPDWSKIPVMPIDTPYLGSEKFPIRAQAQLCWDDEGIHVHLMAVEKDIRCEHTGLLDSVCDDSCLEFFFRPTESMTYFNIEFNPNCALFLGYGDNVDDLVRLIVWDQQKLLNPRANRTSDGWEITYHVPFRFIRQFFPHFKAYEGLQFYGNCYKCGDFTPNPHFFSWSPIVGGEFRFHRPDCFGQLILGSEL